MTNMFIKTKKPDWNKSRAHLLFLSKFDEGRLLGNIPYPGDGWINALGEKPESAVEQFLRDGILEFLPTEKKLSIMFGIAALKGFLRERNLKVSGRKVELIGRLVQSDKEKMDALVNGVTYIGCSATGLQIVKEFNEFCKRELKETLDELLNSLNKKDFVAASEITAVYKSNQVSFVGEIHLRDLNTSHRFVEELRGIFETRPSIYKNLENWELDILRTGAAFITLGFTPPKEIFSPQFTSEIRIKDNIWASRAIIYSFDYRVKMEEFLKKRKEYLRDFKEFGNTPEFPEIYSVLGTYEYLSIQTANDDFVCPECKKLSKKHIRIDDAPELPYEKCTSETGCRCFLTDQML